MDSGSGYVVVCDCGATLRNTNAHDGVVVSQSLLHKCYGNHFSPELMSDKHFFYEERVLAINDDLPKYLSEVDAPRFYKSYVAHRCPSLINHQPETRDADRCGTQPYGN